MGTSNGSKKRGTGLRAGLVALGVVTVAGLSGCGGGGGGGGVCADGFIQTSWDFAQGGCLPGDQVVVRVDDNSMLATFACTDGGGTTPSVQGGVVHTVDLTLFDANSNVVEQSQAINVRVPCGTTVATTTYVFSP